VSRGNPKAAVEAWLIATQQSHLLKKMQTEGIKRKVFAGSEVPRIDATDVENAPRGTSVPEAESEPVQAPLLCFPLAAFTTYDDSLPPDFRMVERSGSGLKNHIRPDGAVFLGLFEIPKEPHTGIVVFGPQGTSSQIANAVSQQYRQEQHALESGRRAAVEAQEKQSSPALIS
jgi:hypothetical protein